MATVETAPETAKRIAAHTLGIDTLETRMSDTLDYHNLPVWAVKVALETAFREGRRAGCLAERMEKRT